MIITNTIVRTAQLNCTQRLIFNCRYGIYATRLAHPQLKPKEEHDVDQWKSSRRLKSQKAKRSVSENAQDDVLSTGAKQATNLYQQTKHDLEDVYTATKNIESEAKASAAEKIQNKSQKAHKTTRDWTDTVKDAIDESKTIQNDHTLESLKEQGAAGMNKLSEEINLLKERGLDEVKDLGKGLANKVSSSAEDLKNSLKKEYANVKRGVTGKS